MEELVLLVKVPLFWWLKSSLPNFAISCNDFLTNITVGCIINKPPTRKVIAARNPPAHSILKFNVDGSSFGRPRPSDIGGVLRDNSGNILVLFSIDTGIRESKSAKLLAISKAMSLGVSYVENNT